MSETAEAIQNYKEFVSAAALAADARIILNRTPAHASVIFEQLFSVAQSDARILTGSLDPDVYGTPGVIAAASEFLSRSPMSSIRILTERKVNRIAHPLLRALDTAGHSGRVLLRLVPTPLQAQYQYHFTVIDGRHFRFERNRASFESVIQFGEATLGAKLGRIFENLYNASLD